MTAVHKGKTATAALEVTAPPSGFTFDGFFDPIQMSTPALVVWNTIKGGQASSGQVAADVEQLAGFRSGSFAGLSS